MLRLSHDNFADGRGDVTSNGKELPGGDEIADVSAAFGQTVPKAGLQID
jgi:hypothetical protein